MGFSNPVFRLGLVWEALGTGDWKVARTGRLESLPYSYCRAPTLAFEFSKNVGIEIRRGGECDYHAESNWLKPNRVVWCAAGWISVRDSNLEGRQRKTQLATSEGLGEHQTNRLGSFQGSVVRDPPGLKFQ